MSYSPDELHAMMIERNRRRTTVLALLLIVVTVICFLSFLIWTSPPGTTVDHMEGGEPTERGKETIEPVSVSLMDTVDKAKSAFIMHMHHEETVSSLEHDLEQARKELDELHMFIEKLNEFLGGL